MAQRLRRLVAAMNGANQALEPYRDVRRIGGGSQDSAHVSVGRAFALTGALDHGWLNAEPRGTPITCGTTRTKATGGPATTQALCRSPSKDTNPNRQASSITSRRCSGTNSRPDIYTFAPADAVPDPLVLQCSTVATAEGDEIPAGGPALAEVLVHTAKVTQLVRLSIEQYNPTNTASQLAQSVSRAVTRRANLGFVAEAAPTPRAVAPFAGLVNVANVVEGDDVSGVTRRASGSHRCAAGQRRYPVAHLGSSVGLGNTAQAQGRQRLQPIAFGRGHNRCHANAIEPACHR